MENFTLQAIARELQTLLIGQRAGRIYQLGVTDLALDFRLRDGRWLMISTDPQRLAFYLTSRDARKLEPAPRSDTQFVSLLRKHLRGARLLSLEKPGYDRIVRMDFAAYAQSDDDEEDSADEAKDAATVPRSLVIELTGRSANVLLLEGESILATLRERASTSEIYSEPEAPGDRFDPFDCPVDRLAAIVGGCEGDVEKAVRENLIGFDQLFARELAARAAPSNDLHDSLQALLDEVFTQPAQPAIYSSAPLDELRQSPGRTDYSLTLAAISLTHQQQQIRTSFPTINQAADVYCTMLDERRHFLNERQGLISSLSARLKKLRGLIKNLRREESGYQNADKYQRYGDLLLTGLHAVVETEGGFQVTDYFDPAQPLIVIPTAEKADAKEAAAHYFKLARKARHGLQAISERLPQVEGEVAGIEAGLACAAGITTRAELKALAEKFASVPTPRRKTPEVRSGRKQKEEKLTGVRRYRSADGYEILVGRSSSDNDDLTFRIARSSDIWFHAADYPGSHVVLRNPQRRDVPPRAIIEAAQLAAKFSQARASDKVAVRYCERKFVSKPRGFAPGQVRLSSFKTVLVEPKEPEERVL